ncbi:MAG: RidA family protein, partial [Vicinamibacterales bacterium]
MPVPSLVAVNPPGWPLPRGHYSHALVHGGLVFVAGQLPIDQVEGRPLTGAPIEAQARLALENMDIVLRAAGSRRTLVLKTTVFVTDIGLWDRVNTVYAAFFGEHRPARAIVPT